MKFEKLSMDKFNSYSLSNDVIFNVVGGANTTYECISGCDGGGSDTFSGDNSSFHTGPLAGTEDVKLKEAVGPA